jgi:hypothetical protein
VRGGGRATPASTARVLTLVIGLRVVLLRETVTNALVMIQPTLMSYGVDGPAQPVMLDASSVQPASRRIAACRAWL